MPQTYESRGDQYGTPIIWARAPVRDVLENPNTGVYFFSDFIFSNLVADTQVDGLQLVGGGGELSYLASVGTGVIDLATGATDNDEAYLHARPCFKIVPNSGKRFFLEARFADLLLTDHAILFGMCEEAMMAADAIVDDCANLATESFTGFRILTDADDELDIITQKDDGAETSILSDASNSSAMGDDAGDWTAATYYRLGMMFDGATTLKFYINGYVVATYTITTATVDTGKFLGPIIGVKAGSAADHALYIDWIRFLAEW